MFLPPWKIFALPCKKVCRHPCPLFTPLFELFKEIKYYCVIEMCYGSISAIDTKQDTKQKQLKLIPKFYNQAFKTFAETITFGIQFYQRPKYCNSIESFSELTDFN